MDGLIGFGSLGLMHIDTQLGASRSGSEGGFLPYNLGFRNERKTTSRPNTKKY